MCFSFEVSLGTGIFCWIIGLHILQKKSLTRLQRMNVYALLIFSSIQFADAILWYIQMKKNRINFLVTSYVVPLLLSLQILFNNYISNKNENKILDVTIFIGIIYLFKRFRGYSYSSACDKLASPVWSEELKLWEVLVFLFLITYPIFDTIAIIHISVVLLILYNLKGGYGSLWCAIACLFSLKYLYEY